MIKLLFPQRCPVCDEPVRIRDGLICRTCKDKLIRVKDPFCLKCGKPLAAMDQEYCRDCREKSHFYCKGRALYEYESVAGAIYRFKYGGRQEYAVYFGAEMAKGLEDFIRRAAPDGLVPVPLSKSRFNRRGYNQAALLAREIGRRLDIPVYEHLVKRVINTVPQKGLNPSARQNNLKRAFKITENDVELSTIIIVDDIYTTGSTIDAVAEVLLQAGVKKIYFVALAVGAGV
ncbi:MAG: double zinc ribbon domain-containing protein [Lachnospiraceae bacterium]